MKTISKILSAGLLAASALAHADTSISATGAGWCELSFGCNNSDTAEFANTFAGNGGYGQAPKWFAFDMLAGTISAATVSIWNDGRNYSYGNDLTYSLYAASSIDFDGLAAGAALGSVSAFVADDGTSHYVNIALNTDGISYLNAHKGQQVIFGGATPIGQYVELFGYTFGTPAATLNVTEVPEPETYGMLLAGLGLVGWIARRKQRAA